MHAEFCVGALQEAIAKYGVPEIMNTDQVELPPSDRTVGCRLMETEDELTG